MYILLIQRTKAKDEVDPITEVFLDELENKYKLIVHPNKGDDVMVLIELVKEFGLGELRELPMIVYIFIECKSFFSIKEGKYP